MRNPVRAFCALFLIFFSLFGATRTSLASPLDQDRGWWVVLASFATCDSNACGSESQLRKIGRLARSCGVAPFNDFSSKFTGFRGGYNVFVVDRAFSKVKAAQMLRQVKPCFPNAYIKYGRYLGE